MATTYKVTFTAAEPWFFGNEKNFLFPDHFNAYANSYFIKSELMPSQSAVLGVLRYLLIPVKKRFQDYTPEDLKLNAGYIGEESFDPDAEKVQSFGKIKRISPVFIIRDGETLVPVPLDHIARITSGGTYVPNETYTPFAAYALYTTCDGAKLAARDYDMKAGLADGFVSLATGRVYGSDELFVTEERVGINRTPDKNGNKGFFKKQYAGFRTITVEKNKKTPHSASFAVYAEIDAPLDGKTFAVTMGQGKSPFAVTFEEAENTLGAAAESFFIEKHASVAVPENASILYCLSDTFLPSPYAGTLFAVTATRDYRAFLTGGSGDISKGKLLYRLIRAGSVFITDIPDEWLPRTEKENAQNIGFNTIINIGGKTK